MKKKTLQTDIQDKACPVLSCHIVALYNIYIINIITDKKLKQLTWLILKGVGFFWFIFLSLYD